jgi:hypothetical protein
VDSSAFVKIPLREPEHVSLRRELRSWDGLVSSRLLGVEARRACGRYGPRFVARVDEALAGTSLVELDDAVLEAAARLHPLELRSRDAIRVEVPA